MLASHLGTLLPLIFIGAVAAVILHQFMGSVGLSGAPAPVAKPLMTQREREMLVQIERILPEYRIHAQVAMGAILKAPFGRGRRPNHADRNAFSQKIVDFVVEDRATGRVVALIEVDDRSHNAERDRARDAMTAGAGYRTLRVPSGARPKYDDVLQVVGVLRDAANLTETAGSTAHPT